MAMPADPLDRAHAVRAVQCSAIPPALHRQLEERWGVPWYEAFGMTETGGDLRVTDRDHDELVGTGCMGGPVSYRQARIVDAADETVPAGQTGEHALHQTVAAEPAKYQAEYRRADQDQKDHAGNLGGALHHRNDKA